MSFTQIDSFEANGREYSVGKFSSSTFGLVFGHPEHTIRFDEVEIDRFTVEFYLTRGRRRVNTGSIEKYDVVADFFENWQPS